MSTLPTIEPDGARGDAAELLAEVRKALGVVPNMTKVMVNSPAVLRGYLDLSAALAGGVLPAGVRERLAVLVAECNGCSYCLSAHTYIGENVAKVEPDELVRARHAESGDQHTAAILALADAIVRSRGHVEADALPLARTAGLTDAEIAEVVAHIALNVFTNYLNVLSDVEIDWPVVRPHQHV
jgi:uncharacterized peroxidase-related enzyme